MIVYKIRSKKTGEYSMGGNDVSWGRDGKMWKARGPLSNHFSQLTAEGRKQYREHDAELLHLEVVEVPLSIIPVSAELAAVGMRKAEREAIYKKQMQAYKLEREKAEYERLRSVFGDK